MSHHNVGWDELLPALGLDGERVTALIAKGYLPQGGPGGWDVAECLMHLSLATSAQAGDWNDDWHAAAEALTDLNQLSSKAIEDAQAAPSRESIAAAASIGNRFFRLYNLFVACIGRYEEADPSYKRPAFDKALFDYDDTLARLLRTLDDRAAVHFLQ